MRQLELTERILRLRGVPVLRTLPAPELVALAASLRPVAFRRGEVLLREDEPPRSYFLVTTGTVTLRRKDKRIGTVRAPGGVGFMSFLARNAGGTSAVAESFVEGFEVTAEAMEDVFEDHFSVVLATLRFVVERLIEQNRINPPSPFVPPTVAFENMIGDAPLGIVERIFLLRTTRAFTDANVNSLATVARKMDEMRVGAGEALWRVGDRADQMFYALKGMMSLRWQDGKGHEVVQSVGPGYVLGGAEAIAALPRWNELVTVEPAVVLRGTRDALIDLFEDDHELALRFISILATLVVTVWDRKAGEGITSVGRPDDDAAPPAEAAAAPDAAAAP